MGLKFRYCLNAWIACIVNQSDCTLVCCVRVLQAMLFIGRAQVKTCSTTHGHVPSPHMYMFHCAQTHSTTTIAHVPSRSKTFHRHTRTCSTAHRHVPPPHMHMFHRARTCRLKRAIYRWFIQSSLPSDGSELAEDRWYQLFMKKKNLKKRNEK